MPLASAAFIGLASAGIDAWASSSSQHKANRANIRLQREQQAWEQMMSNTAIQRRRTDIEKAGGNPALAFTGGGEASTPSVAPARVEPTVRPGALSSGMNTGMQRSEERRVGKECRSRRTPYH